MMSAVQSALRSSALLAACAATLLITVSAPAAAQWKWRDASGRVTASDLPPPREVPDKDIIQRPASATPRARPATAPAAPASGPAAPAAASAPAVAKPVDKDLEAKKRAAEQAQQEKTKAEEQRQAALRAENCGRARQALATLESGQRLARVNDKGEREILDDKARDDEVRRARTVVASDCK